MTEKPNTSFGRFAELWDAKAQSGRMRSTQATIKAIFEFLGNLKGKKIYEIATGNGALARRLVASGAKELWASDIAPELIDIAKTKYDTKKIKYLVREATNFTGIPKNYFDAIIVHQAMFYIKDIETLAKGVSKVLKPKGSFIFTLLHPLFPEARVAMGETTAMGDGIDNLLKLQENYLKNHPRVITKDWDGTQVSYLSYKRPISYYINLCSKYGLYIEAMQEPKSQMLRKGKLAKTNIPSGMIIKAVKV